MAAAASRRPSSVIGAALVAALSAGLAAPALADPPRTRDLNGRICDLIETHAQQNSLPEAFFARLIWKESRFDPNAVSPVGAEGIAQFMPGTAKMRGLDDSFDIEKAIPASAKYLGELKSGFGNLGLAAAAYNAGETRVTRWLNSGGFLPLETEDYVLDIMGEPADNFITASYAGTIHPLDTKRDFDAACRALPRLMSATIAMATVHQKPWGIQVAGNFRRAAAIKQWQRVKGRFPALLSGHEPVVSRVRAPYARRGIYAVRIGAETRGEAGEICAKLRSVGGSCIVARNR